MKNKTRYIAHFIIEASTPMAIASGEKGMTVDRLIVRDANDLPYIPGTSLAGVLRHLLEDGKSENIKEKYKSIFGFQDNDKKSIGKGSDLIISSAYLIDENGKSLKGFVKLTVQNTYRILTNYPNATMRVSQTKEVQTQHNMENLMNNWFLKELGLYFY